MKNSPTGFYKTSAHGGVGSTVMFHGINGAGYVSNIDQAHIYSLEEMKEIVANGWMRNYEEHPLSVKLVDELATWRVDMQHIDAEDEYPSKVDSNDEYVAVRKGNYDGNDLKFACDLGDSYDYSLAKVYREEDVQPYIEHGNQYWDFIPKSITDEKARRTFQFKNINRRKMITGAGITGIRKPRKSNATGKSRGNCPECGKITWDWNPYENAYCPEHESDILY